MKTHSQYISEKKLTNKPIFCVCENKKDKVVYTHKHYWKDML